MHAAMQEDIVNAMALTGQVLMGQSVMVKSSEVRLLLVCWTILGFGRRRVLVAYMSEQTWSCWFSRVMLCLQLGVT